MTTTLVVALLVAIVALAVGIAIGYWLGREEPIEPPEPEPGPEPEPEPEGIVFGHHKVVQNGTADYCAKEMQEMAACGGRVMRTDFYNGGPNENAIPAAEAAGIPHLSLIVSGSPTTPPAIGDYVELFLRAARENPGAWLEHANESGGRWTAKQCVERWNAAYAALREEGYDHVVLMGSMSGSERTSYGRGGARQWAKELVAEGAEPGVSFDWGNYHLYQSIWIERDWMNYWTPYQGESCQSILGLDTFAMTEFNTALGDAGNNETTQAQKVTEWMAELRKLDGKEGRPRCAYATLYAMSDDAGGTTNGYGLVIPKESWRRREAWYAFQEQAA